MSHKALQLCKQVRRSLELSLMSECADELLQSMTVESVEPAPDDKHLRATFSLQDAEPSLSREEVLARLEAARPVLTEGLIQTISRRKVPDIRFEVIKAAE